MGGSPHTPRELEEGHGGRGHLSAGSGSRNPHTRFQEPVDCSFHFEALLGPAWGGVWP